MNYFNYFTEIETHFQRKRGAQIWLSPVDWALIASWREADIPLAAVLAGIDQAFEKFESGRRRDAGRRRSLVYCAAAVLTAAEAMRAASVGARSAELGEAGSGEDAGFSRERIAAHLGAAARALAACAEFDSGTGVAAEVLAALQRLEVSLDTALAGGARGLEELDRVLTVLDEKLQAALLQVLPVETLTALRAAVDRELVPYRRQLCPEQLALIERQCLQRRLLEHTRLPRLSLFYMR